MGSTDRKWPMPRQNGIRGGKLIVDTHGTEYGFIFAATTTITKRRLKLRVSKDDTTLTYDLNGEMRYELFPLQLGNGLYTVRLYENIAGNQYRSVGAVPFYVTLNRQDAPFLIPNQYINYSMSSEIVSIADQICDGKDEQESFRTICDHIRTSYAYDYIKAFKVKAGTLPDLDGTVKRHMGICQDIAAVTVAMMRTQGIPSKLVIGYADKKYHAWTLSKVNGNEILFDPTAALCAIPKVKKYTQERVY